MLSEISSELSSFYQNKRIETNMRKLNNLHFIGFQNDAEITKCHEKIAMALSALTNIIY